MPFIDLVGEIVTKLVNKVEGTTGIARTQIRSLSEKDDITAGLTRLIRGAHQSIFIATGELLGSLYDDPQVLRALRSAKKRSIDFEVLVGNGFDGESKAVEVLKDTLFVLPEPPPLHFAVIDARHVRIEPPHEPGELPPNKLAVDVPFTAVKLRKLFEEMKSKAEPYSEWKKKQDGNQEVPKKVQADE